MGLKPGYKQTEAGTIPDDWDVMRFVQAVGSYIDYRGRTPRKLGLSWGGGNILALSANNVQMGRIDPDKEAYYGSEELYRKWMVQGECELGDVLLTMEAPLGNVAQIPDSRKYILSQRVLLIKPKEWLLRSFFTHYLKGNYFQNQLAINSTGSTAKGIQRKKLDELPIYLPPTKAEQEAIAEALSDADALIESMEKLIAKKRLVKQGAMQELLTGKKRLPEFKNAQSGFRDTEIGPLPEDWSVVDVKQVTRSHKQGYYTKDRYLPEGVKLVRITDLLNPHIEYTSMPMLRLSANDHDLYRIHISDFLFARSGAIGRYGIVYEDIDAVFGSYIIRFSFDSTRLQNEYFGYLYETDIVWRQLLSIIQGSSNININASNIKSILIPLPHIEEQTAIAEILSDMDVEIDALETKLAKARQIKLGMMQVLLTGRIRLL